MRLSNMNFRRTKVTFQKLILIFPLVIVIGFLSAKNPSYPTIDTQPSPSLLIATNAERVIKWNPKFDRVENDRIFFHETTGRDDLANLRQLCAVESAARENPDRSIQIYLQSDYLNNSSSLYSLMKEYPNVVVILINSTQYFENTPLEEWYKKGEWRKSPFSTEHFSDYIRILSIYKGGGMYMDLDFVTLKRFDREIFRNFVPIEDNSVSLGLTGSALHFNRDHPILKPMMDYLSTSYRPKQWTHSGPSMIQKVVLKYCRKRSPKPTYPKSLCPGVKVLPIRYLYPVPFGHWKKYFQRNFDVDLSQSYAIHLYNKASKNQKVLVGSKQIYSITASIHCPLSYSLAVHSF